MTANRFICALSVASLLGGCQSVPSPALAPDMAAVPHQESYFPSDPKLKELIQTFVDEGESKGIVLGLLEPDGRRRILAYGDAGSGAPSLSSKTVFEIGSMAKTFTATILTDMVRRGEVSLDDPVAKYLPAGVKVPSRNGREITLVDLATHTSGLPRSPLGYKIPDPSNPYAQFDAEHLYEFLSLHELQRDVGAEWEYSNLGVGLLGRALARAAGSDTIGDLIRQRITGPLTMNMTDYVRPNPAGNSMAKGHNPDGDVVPYWDFAVLAGAGGLNSNAEDMLTYLAANMDEPRSPLEAAMRDTHEPRYPQKVKGNSQALGWTHRVRRDRTIIHHGGVTAGFMTTFAFDPATRAGVVVLANSRQFVAGNFVAFQLLKGGRPDFEKASVPLPQIEPLLGIYEYEGGSRLLFTRDGKLFARVTGGEDVEVYPAGNDRFFFGPGSLDWFEVKRDPAGEHVMSMYLVGSNEAFTSIRSGPVPVN